MASLSLIKILLVLFCSSAKFKFITSQQVYYSTSYCSDASASAAGYICNGLEHCKTYIIFQAQAPNTSAIAIAALLGSNASQIAQINGVSFWHEFVLDEKVVVPIDCDCSGNFYQSNTSYTVQTQNNNHPQLIATEVFQHLTTCTAIENHRDNQKADYSIGDKLVIPLRCACPTENRTDQGVNYLITYAIQVYDSVSSISMRFGADMGEMIQANEMADRYDSIQALTTLLIPLRNPPSNTPFMHHDPLERLAALKMFSFIDLQSATDDFSPSCLIKGSVYRGKINGDLAAIKRMKTDVSKEINLLAKINHFNLVRVLGVCFNEGQCYIVYEYASKGPLSDWLKYGDSDEKFLSWTQRIQIILDIARGLNHIHSYFSPALVHMGVKSSNVLLDSDLRGKISNFGLVRSVAGDQESQASGKGYLCPEFLKSGQVSPTLDVYAFGVLMMEIVTGKQVVVLLESVRTGLAEVLVGVLGEEDGKESLKRLIDPSLRGNYPFDLAIFMFGLIDHCLKQDPSNRPGMEEIVPSLSKVLTASLSWESSGA